MDIMIRMQDRINPVIYNSRLRNKIKIEELCKEYNSHFIRNIFIRNLQKNI